MSWNGNDLFNSTLMGGMPSGADPHQYLTTDGNGKPHWEDTLAYEESTVEVILPETKSSYLSPGQRHDLKNKATKAIKIGDTGILTINGVEYAYTGTKSTDTTNYLGSAIWLKTADTVKQWVYVDPDFLTVSVVCKNGSPYGFYTFIIAEKATTIKTIDPKYLPSGSGGGGVMYISGLESLIVPAYADAALTTMLSYDQAKEIIQKQFAVSMSLDGMQGSLYPVFALGNDTNKNANIVIISPGDGSATGITLTFSDTPES